MTLTLRLGVIDIPYGHEPKKVPKKRSKPAPKSDETITTGDVAEILEAEYHVMEVFANLHLKDIAKEVEVSLQGSLENVMLGAPPPRTPWLAAETEIDSMFKKFLTNKEMEKIGYPGVPTKAALAGVNHRLKHPYAKTNKRRPSFIDTATYQASFKSEIE